MTAIIALPRSIVLAYGVLGLPLAFAALPLYVHVPKLYADDLGLPLAWVGAGLLAARAADAVADPLIGWFSDRFGRRRPLIFAGLPLLIVGVGGLLMPPSGAGMAWMMVLLFIAYAGYSLSSINYHAWGAELAPTPNDRTRVVASREGFGLGGVLLAAMLPALLADSTSSGLARMGMLFAPLVMVAALVTLGRVSREAPDGGHRRTGLVALRDAFTHAPFARLLVVFALGGTAAAVPASTVLFFVEDVVQRPDSAGTLLALYFGAGALSLPLWVAAAKRFGKVNAWMASMGLAMLAFVWAVTVGAGELGTFSAICILSGMALGADLALPPSILADQVSASRRGAGAFFGWWNFTTKANLALAAGVALPLLDMMGYAPGSRDATALNALTYIYALLPVALKAAALALLWWWRDQVGALR